MHPSKFKVLLPALALKHGLSEETVEKVLRTYYKEAQRKFSSLEHTAIELQGLGIFRPSTVRIERKIRKLTGLVESIKDNPTLRCFSIRTERGAEIVQLQVLSTKIEAERARELLVRTKRHNARTT